MPFPDVPVHRPEPQATWYRRTEVTPAVYQRQAAIEAVRVHENPNYNRVTLFVVLGPVFVVFSALLVILLFLIFRLLREERDEEDYDDVELGPIRAHQA